MKRKNADVKTKLTKNQALVLNVLSNASQPLGAYAILDKLRSHGFKAPLTAVSYTHLTLPTILRV